MMGDETKLSNVYLKSIGQKFDLEIIFILDLSYKNIKLLGSLNECINLAILDLSHNNIRSLSGINVLVNLKNLNLSFNLISSLESLTTLCKMDFLNLQSNKIFDFDSLNPLGKMKRLTHLELQSLKMTDGNPVCQKKDYRSTVLAKLENIKSLDGHRKHLPMLLDKDIGLGTDNKIKEYEESEEVWFNQEVINGKGATNYFDPRMLIGKKEKELNGDMLEAINRLTSIDLF